MYRYTHICIETHTYMYRNTHIYTTHTYICKRGTILVNMSECPDKGLLFKMSKILEKLLSEGFFVLRYKGRILKCNLSY